MTLVTALDILSADSRAATIPGTAASPMEHDIHRVRGGGSSHDDNATTTVVPTVLETGSSTKFPVRMSIALRPMDSQLSLPHGQDGSDLPSSGRNSPFESMSASAVSSASCSFSSDSSSSSNASFASAFADILEAMETIPPLKKGGKETGEEDLAITRKTTTTTSTSVNMTSPLTHYIKGFEASSRGKQEQQEQQQQAEEEEGKKGLEREKRGGEEGSGKGMRKEAAEEELKEERQQPISVNSSSSSSSKREVEMVVEKREGREENVYAISSSTAAAAAAAAAAAPTTVTNKKKTLLTPSSTSSTSTNKKKGLLFEASPPSSHSSSMFSSPSALPPSSSSSISPMDDPELCSSTTITFRQLGQGGKEEGIEEDMLYEDEGGSVCSGGFGLEEGEGAFEAPTFESFMSREAAAKREAVRAGWRALARVVVAALLVGIVVWVFVMYR